MTTQPPEGSLRCPDCRRPVHREWDPETDLSLLHDDGSPMCSLGRTGFSTPDGRPWFPGMWDSPEEYDMGQWWHGSTVIQS